MTRRLSESLAIDLMKKAGFKPLVKYPGSGVNWKSKCLKCGYISNPKLGNVKNLNSRCKNCRRGQLKTDEVKARLKSWNLVGLGEFHSTRENLLLKCTICEYKFSEKLKHLKELEVKCPNCRKRQRKMFTDAAIIFFKSSELTPLIPYKNSHTPWKSRCNICKKIVKPRFSDVRNGHSGCGYCAKTKVDRREAKKLFELNGLKPLDTFKNSHTPLRSICLNCGTEVYPRYSGLRSGQGGCIKCGISKRAKSKTYSDELATSIMLKNSLKPLVKYTNSKVPWKSKCLKCNNVVYPMLNTITSGDGGCKYCGKNYVDSNKAQSFVEEVGFTPLQPYSGANTAWLMKHTKCGRTVSPSYSSLKRGGSCKFCTNKGFQFHLPGYIYLATNKLLNSHKIGIATLGIRSDRMVIHEKYGWILWRSKSFDVGNDAYLIEQEILNWLRNHKNLNSFLSSNEMPQGGWTETVDATEIDLPTIWAKVEELSRVKR